MTIYIYIICTFSLLLLKKNTFSTETVVKENKFCLLPFFIHTFLSVLFKAYELRLTYCNKKGQISFVKA